MKRLAALMMAFVMMISFCACSSQPSYKGTAEELDAILDMISEIPVGTMGSSMTITARAVELLDWCEVTAMSGEDIAAQTKQAYDRIDAPMQEMFLEQVTVTVNTVGNLSREEVRGKMLEAAGFNSSLTWTDGAFSLAACIDDLL